MEPIAVISSLVILSSMLIVCVPAKIADAYPRTMRRLVTSLVGCGLLLALLLALTLLAHGGQPYVFRLSDLFPGSGVHFALYLDGASSLMLLLVSFIGFVVSRFSIRYLDGEAGQGRYFRWLAFTIGAVSLMVAAGNLLLFVVAWVLTSLGLHQLLLHYRHRPTAHRAAWRKFAISRLGDTFLIAAMVVTWRSFGSLDFETLFAQVAEASADSRTDASHAAIAWLLMFGAVTKSAQFPFHVWLPETMETPTPVSALMHAGIVNAGGYLVIRLSPLFAPAPETLLTLALIGAFTACFASVVMMTQTSVKRALAYSTIAQMGFMMLQCGLGAFSAAMLHLIAHSLYKAHAFLNSGSVVTQSRSIEGAALPVPDPRVTILALLSAVTATSAAYFAISLTVGVDHFHEPSGLVLAFILFLALTSWGWQVLSLKRRQSTFIALTSIAGLCLAYLASYAMVDHLMQPTRPTIDFPMSANLVFLGIAVAFALSFALHAVSRRQGKSAWLAALRTHAVNGFYIDALFRRVFDSLAKS